MKRLIHWLRTLWAERRLSDSTVWMAASLILHSLLLGGMALVVLHAQRNTADVVVFEAGTVEEFKPLDGPVEPEAIITGTGGDGDDTGTSSTAQRLPDITPIPSLSIDNQNVNLKAAQTPSVPEFHVKNDFTGRDATSRGRLLGKQGGNEASERAVKLGLQWLAKHQSPDGGWNFNHGPDSPGGLAECRTGATGLALLSFLGAGHTHRATSGEYKKVVERGLKFLVEKIKYSSAGGDLRGKVVANEGMYAHAIATLALCEALAMSRDSKLKNPAQRAIDFIVDAQDKAGGWRYKPHEPGDTTVTGWQIMALKSAKAAQLKVPDDTIRKAMAFLDSVQLQDGARYRYVPGGDSTPAVTAIGVLCRMYLGWTPQMPALQKGVETLSALGPDAQNLYFNYYATQALHHWGGEPWANWNGILRERLVKTQIEKDDAAGSWNPTGDHGGGAGGRLYQTSLSVMTLEVYYRYLPMYQRQGDNDR